jgi:hypothetical protein
MNKPLVVRLLRELASALEEEDRRELADVVYTSTSLPPGITSREHFATECRRLKVGVKHGRIWTVPAIEWLNARNAKKPKLRVVGFEDVDRIDGYINKTNVRATRRG